ncbi:MAG: hypothetical protein ACR2JB_30085 [Bryobacteraceae bacterium]
MDCKRTCCWNTLTEIARSLLCTLQCATAETRSPEVVVDASPEHEVNSFDRDQPLGAPINVQPYALIDQVYAAPMLRQMLSAGWGPDEASWRGKR